MAIVHATLAHEIDGKVEYIYPKTIATLVEYDSTQNVKEKIDSMVLDIEENINNNKTKVNKPLDEDGNPYDGKVGQMLETNGDGSTSWTNCAKVYVGTGTMPDGYDVQINPHGTIIEIDTTLTKDGAVAEAKATGAAITKIYKYIDDEINEVYNYINTEIGNTIAASY